MSNRATAIETDDDVFRAVEEFAARYGMHRCTMADVLGKKTPEQKEQYVITHEWTDGDQVTFFVRKIKDLQRPYGDDTCAAAVDDWEENRPALICKRLYDACLKHKVFTTVEVNPYIDGTLYK